MVTPPPGGVFVPVPTFFAPSTAANYNVLAPPPDVATQSDHALFLAKNGIHGLVLLGSTGEAIHLTNAERTEILAGVRQHLDANGFRDYPIMAGTCAQSIAEVAQQLKDAQSAGAQWGLVLAPGFFASAASQDGVVQWYHGVAGESPIPILVYNYPGVSNGLVLTPTTIEKIAQHANVVGCKLSHGAMDDHALVALSPAIDHARFRTFSGLGQILLPLLTVGGAGVIDGLAGIFPKVVVRLYNLYKASEEKGAGTGLAEQRALQYTIAKGEKIFGRWGTIGCKEALERVRGFGTRSGSRLPLAAFPDGDAEWARWKDVMEELEKVEQSLA